MSSETSQQQEYQSPRTELLLTGEAEIKRLMQEYLDYTKDQLIQIAQDANHKREARDAAKTLLTGRYGSERMKEMISERYQVRAALEKGHRIN